MSFVLERLAARETSTHHGPLTATQRELLGWLASGFQSASLAALLGISRAELVQRVEAICPSLGVTSLPETIAFGCTHGILRVG